MKKTMVNIRSKQKLEMINITRYLEEIIETERLIDGKLSVFIPHTTAGVTINENCDPDVVRDLNAVIQTLIPKGINFQHSEGNSDAHFFSSLVSVSLTVFVEDSHLLLGTWQGIYFWEFDGPRNRKVYIISE